MLLCHNNTVMISLWNKINIRVLDICMNLHWPSTKQHIMVLTKQVVLQWISCEAGMDINRVFSFKTRLICITHNMQ